MGCSKGEEKINGCLYFTISKMFRLLNKIAEESFEGMNMCSTHAFLLVLLQEEPKGLSVSEISEALTIAPSTVTRFVDKLAAKGYVERIKIGKEVEVFEGIEALDKASKSSRLGWNFTYPMDSNYYIRDIKVDDLENELYLKVLKNVLMTLDNSIVDIKKVDKIEHTYAIVMNNKNLIIQEGKVLDPNNILSSGTKAGIEISGFITALMEHRNGFYYCDEKFSYIHSDIEKAILSVMISKLGDGEQLFFTTHNLDITDMDLPKHSFLFMRKENISGKFIISCESVSNRLKKATDSVRNAVDNDIFAVAPRIELIYDLAYEDDIDDVLDEDAG